MVESYDGEVLIDVVYDRLQKMYGYYNSPEITEKASGDYVETCKQLKECMDLCEKILNYNYGKEADKYFNLVGNICWLDGNIEDVNYNKWIELTEQAIKERNKDISKLFTDIGNYIPLWW